MIVNVILMTLPKLSCEVDIVRFYEDVVVGVNRMGAAIGLKMEPNDEFKKRVIENVKSKLSVVG